MMTFFAIYDPPTGRILGSGTCESSLLGHYPSSGEAVLAVGQMVANTTDWVNAGMVEQRPGLVDLPATRTLAVDEDWVIPGIPDGTEVWVDDALIGTVDTTGLTMSFPLAATWQLRLVPPFPWKPGTCEVTTS